MARTISVPLSAVGVNRAIKELQQLKARLSRMGQEISRRLAEIGMQSASVGFSSAMYDGVNDASVSVEPTETGYQVVASGNAVCYIEFGAGVHYNPGGGGYPIAKPPGIVGPGEFGKGRGAQDSWMYKGEPGTNGIPVEGTPYVLTHGNPAQMPMYYALEAMRGQVEQIVKDVFANG